MSGSLVLRRAAGHRGLRGLPEGVARCGGTIFLAGPRSLLRGSRRLGGEREVDDQRDGDSDVPRRRPDQAASGQGASSPARYRRLRSWATAFRPRWVSVGRRESPVTILCAVQAISAALAPVRRAPERAVTAGQRGSGRHGYQVADC
jgi:hypothetical protein